MKQKTSHIEVVMAGTITSLIIALFPILAILSIYTPFTIITYAYYFLGWLFFLLALVLVPLAAIVTTIIVWINEISSKFALTTLITFSISIILVLGGKIVSSLIDDKITETIIENGNIAVKKIKEYQFY